VDGGVRGVEKDEWWAAFAERVRTEAEERGGTCVVPDDPSLRLEPPRNSQGEIVRLTRYDQGYCKIEAGLALAFRAYYVDFDDDNGILRFVLGVLDGRATEAVDVSAEGEWTAVRASVRFGDDGSAREAKSWRPVSTAVARVPAAQTFARRIRPWVG
jgi:hypothetical protein